MLCLRYRHSVSRDDYNFFNPDKFCGRIFIFIYFRLFLFDLFSFHCGRGFRLRRGCDRCRRRLSSGFARKNCHKTAVHCLAHYLRKQKSRRADYAAYRNEQQIADGKTCDCACYAAQRVKQRNGYRHIRAAYSDCKRKSEEPRRKENEREHSAHDAERTSRSEHGEHHYADKHKKHRAHLNCRVSLPHDGFLGQNFMEFASRDKAARQSEHTDRESD